MINDAVNEDVVDDRNGIADNVDGDGGDDACKSHLQSTWFAF